jgi:ABC-type phosphate/phosphonate transport system ATPase subunit
VADPANAVELEGNFSWGFNKDRGDPVDDKLSNYLDLKDISLNVKKGSFVCIVGDVGSGKSSLLHAINGEMIHIQQSEMENARKIISRPQTYF